MTVPAVRPLTTPTFVIVATELLDDVHVPFVEGVTFADDPAQMAEAPPKEGAEGGVLITTSDEGTEVHVFAFVTLKVYVVLEGRPVTVYEVPDPEYVVPPGSLVMVQEPVDGKPVSITLPVGEEHVG